MACCYPDSCEYTVTPCLVSPPYSRRCCEEQPLCYPCLPCTPKAVYCCEKRSPKPHRKCEKDRHHEEVCCEPRYCRERTPPRHCKQRSRSPPPPRRCCRHEDCHEPCYPACKPVKTQYVIPCYRYEDGRINQPTLLMRRACEVAVGSRMRRKPFVEESYSADEFKQVRRYASEDERGNCCFHYEKKNNCSDTDCCAAPHCHNCSSCHDPCMPSSIACNKPCCQLCCPSPVSSPPCCNYMDCVVTGAITKGGSCCYYC